jgi:hypothetical protein
MVKPPIEFAVRGILEVDDSVDVAIKEVIREDVAGLVGHSCISELRSRGYRFLQETAEEGGRSRSVEAVVVVEHSDKHEMYRSKTYKDLVKCAGTQVATCSGA